MSQQSDNSSGQDIGAVAEALRKKLRSAIRPLSRASKALDAICTKGAPADLATIGPALATLADADLSAVGLDEARRELVGLLSPRVETLRRDIRTEVLRALQRLGDEAGVDIRQVSERPVTVAIAPVAVEMDFERAAAHVSYAREQIETCPLDAAQIFETRRRVMARITEEAVPSEAFFGDLCRAYRIVLATAGLRAGERVDLVDLLAPLALLRVPRVKWRTLAAAKLDTYPRYLMAYQLRRLRRDGLLLHDGLRVELGTATGGSTKRKRDVLYLPTSATDGQYYLSIRVVSAKL